MRCIMALRQSFALAISPLCLPTLGQKLVGRVVLFIFRQHLHVLPELTCLRRATCLSCSPLGLTIEFNPKGDNITCPAIGLYSSPADHSTMGHIVLDLTSLAYQPKSRARSARPKKHVTFFALSEQKSAYPARTRELDEDEHDKPLVCPDRTAVSQDEDDKPQVQSASRGETVKRECASKRKRSYTVTKKIGTSSPERSICQAGTGYVRNFA